MSTSDDQIQSWCDAANVPSLDQALEAQINARRAYRYWACIWFVGIIVVSIGVIYYYLIERNTTDTLTYVLPSKYQI